MPIVKEGVVREGFSFCRYSGWEIEGRKILFGHSVRMTAGGYVNGYVERRIRVGCTVQWWEVVDYKRIGRVGLEEEWSNPVGRLPVDVIRLDDGSDFVLPPEGYALGVFGRWDTAPFQGGMVIPTVKGWEAYRKVRGRDGGGFYLSYDGKAVVLS